MTNDERRNIEHDCARLVAAYANRNDAADWEGVAALFDEAGRFARPAAPDVWIEGREAILAAYRSRPARATRHLCTNIVIDVLSADEATGESAMALYLSPADVKLGTFHDRFVRTVEGWRFAERRGSLIF
ncbi:nuclear transport factor 2 family protein [Sphingomonas sp.]|uniref:nuclear transport factor 2 family protein n=1 Tax=Sphingomonas sp. TaxID=28214 RepID=UPI0031D175C2